MGGLYKTERQRLELIRNEMIQDRRAIEPQWRDRADFISPHRLALSLYEQRDIGKDMSFIIDGSTSHARSILEAGMTTSICSPSRPWFRVTPPDPELSEWGPVKDWLFDVQKVMLNGFARSNYYSIVPSVFGDAATFGLGAQSMEEDFDTIVSCMDFPVGSYCIGVDHRGIVNVFQRDFELTVRQLVEMFGRYDKNTGKPNWEAFSKSVKRAWDRSNYGMKVEVRHMIEPNLKYDRTRFESKFKRFYSCYWEAGDTEGKFLREKGYEHFPVLAPRWSAAGLSGYAIDCPGFRAVGDVMQLQKGEELGLQGLELTVKPPMKAHPDLKGSHTSQVPGGITWTESPEHFQPLFQTTPNLVGLEAKQQAVRGRAEKYYYMNFFLRVIEDDRRQRASAAEIIEGKEEKFMILQPVLTQMDRDLNNPAIDNMFLMCVRQNRFRKPPKELAGMPLQVEYINIMSQAQKMLGIAVQDRFISFAERVIKINPESADKFDFDQAIDEYGDALGVAPRIVRSDDRVEEIRSNRSRAQQAQAQGEAMVQGTQAVKNLAQADLSGENALTELMAAGGVPGGGV